MADSETRLQARIGSGEQVLLVEIAPPKGADPAALKASAQRFAGKVHAVGLSDNRHGIRMSALAAAGILAADGVETVLHMVTRDRNRLALTADGLGAQALGVRNVFCTSGTHQTLGISPRAKNVFDIDSIHLLNTLAHLGSNGTAGLAPVAPFCLGAVAAPFADPAELQLMRLAKKVAAGAQFLVTQPVYDVERFRAWWEQVAQRGLDGKVAILAGIQPLLDAEAAKAYASARPSPCVPQSALDRLASAGDAKAQRAAGIAAAVETVKQLSALKGLRGFQICAEEDEDAALEIIEQSGLSSKS